MLKNKMWFATNHKVGYLQIQHFNFKPNNNMELSDWQTNKITAPPMIAKLRDTKPELIIK